MQYKNHLIATWNTKKIIQFYQLRIEKNFKLSKCISLFHDIFYTELLPMRIMGSHDTM